MKYGSLQWIYFQQAQGLGLSSVMPNVLVTSPTPTQSNSKTASDNGNISFEQAGGVIGGIIGAGVYAVTYPITWLDGPLPFIDFAWLGGLAWATGKGIQKGAGVGRAIDSSVDYIDSL